MDEPDATDAEKKATYPEIKEYGMEHPRQAKCPPEKEAAIMEALQHFGMI